MPSEDRLEVEEAVEALGGVKEDFRPHSANIVASRIIGPFCFVAGATMGFYVLRDADFSNARLVILGFGALIMVSGSAMFLRSLVWSKYRLLLCRDGLIEVRAGSTRVCRWDDIEKISQFDKRELPSRWRIYFGEKRPIELNRDTTSEIDRLMKIIWLETDRRGVPWHWEISLMG